MWRSGRGSLGTRRAFDAAAVFFTICKAKSRLRLIFFKEIRRVPVLRLSTGVPETVG